MYLEGKYLLVRYRDIPHMDFICENGGDLRIRVTKVPKLSVKDKPQGFLYEAADRCIFVFENISNKIIEEQEELIRAIHWYKSKFGLNSMNFSYKSKIVNKSL